MVAGVAVFGCDGRHWKSSAGGTEGSSIPLPSVAGRNDMGLGFGCVSE
jgi:hypothetical protein